MRICLLSRYFDFRNAGVGRVGMEIAKGLRECGHDVITVSTGGTSLYSYFFYTLAEIPIRLLRLPDADIYHAITPMEAMWLPKYKSVVTFHDLFQHNGSDKLGSGMGYSKWKTAVGVRYFRMVCQLAKKCRGITAVSEKTAQEVFKTLGVKAKVIASGIREDLDWMPGATCEGRIGYLGQLDRRKRVNLLVDAFKRGSLGQLALGGTGVDMERLKAQADGDNRIKFHGYVPDDELVQFYSSLEAFVFPTWMEGYGLPIIEAMACKKPVVVLQDADIPHEIKSRCAVVQDLGMPLSQYESLRQVCDAVDVEDNYRWAKAHTWDRAVNQYLELYEEVLHE